MVAKLPPLSLPRPPNEKDTWDSWSKELRSWGKILTNLINKPILGGLSTFTVAALPSAAVGSVAYASNGRKTGEGVGAGTGVLVYRSGDGSWRRAADDTVVVA